MSRLSCFSYTMDLSRFPPELIRYMSTFIYIVSWRAEYHYNKLRNFLLQLRRDVRIPPHIMSNVIEHDDHYEYPHPHREYPVLAYKWDAPSVAFMKHHYLNLYTDPLLHYLAQYRVYILNKAWVPNVSFTLLRVRVDVLSPSMYTYHLFEQGSRESCIYSDWKGCLPLSAYKKACLSRIPTI